MTDTRTRTVAIITDHFGVTAAQAHPDPSFADDLGADDLGGIELTMLCEEEFGIDIHDVEIAAAFTTVGAWLQMVERKLGVSA